MADYKVIADFTDLQDGKHIYRKGDNYPREGKEVDEKRVAELSGTDNKRGEALVVAVSAGKIKSGDSPAKHPKHNGGGWYELSNGETVQGREAALEAEAKLQK